MEHALICPQCNAPLSPSKFARSVVCSYCGATVKLDESLVPASRFHDAYQAWNAPHNHAASVLTIDDTHWAIERFLAEGEISDLYTGRRARWPTELVTLKLLRESGHAPAFENEWKSLELLHASEAKGASVYRGLLPQLVRHGWLSDGDFSGRHASIFRRKPGFRFTFEDVRAAYPQGIPPQASVWVWRRLLEMLSFIHNSEMVHGAVLPAHLLVQDNEHGIYLVGYSRCAKPGAHLSTIPSGFEDYYSGTAPSGGLVPKSDLIMSARCLLYLLGGEPARASLPESVPAPLAELVIHTANGDWSADAWALRQELGTLADRVFGEPRFNPIIMPS